jgi:hypothetical protein
MPPRYAYWTILAGGLPTAFRAAERDELLPTFNRILEKHPDAQMKYFAKGKLWDSREASQAASPSPPRGRDWRPGGNHRDPRQKFADAKRQKNQDRRKRRFESRQPSAQAPGGERPRRPLRRDARPDSRTGAPRSAPPRTRRAQGTEEPKPPRRPPGPNREPPPDQVPDPAPPPRPSEPRIPPPGPPERGRHPKGRGRR